MPLPSVNPGPTNAPLPANPGRRRRRARPLPAPDQGGEQLLLHRRGTLTALATDAKDGASVCSGINQATVAPPSGYLTYYFVAVQFPDGQRISAGYIQSPTERHDFGSIQDANGGNKRGIQAAAGSLAAGSHTYCVYRAASGWVMTDDGRLIFTTADEKAGSAAGSQLTFQSSAAQNGGSGHPFKLVVAGFHDIAIDNRPPTQLTGRIQKL